jgi:hypothetical protein
VTGHKITGSSSQKPSDKQMIIKTKPTKSVILSEGSYLAKVASIKGSPDNTSPKKILFGFKVEGHEGEVSKELPYSFEEGAPLRKDVETLLGKQLRGDEAENGLDLDTLLHKECQIVVMHKSSAGGRSKAVVSVIMPAPQASKPAGT